MTLIHSTAKVDLSNGWNLDAGEWKNECTKNIPASLPVLDNSNDFSRLINNDLLLDKQSEPGAWRKKEYEHYSAKQGEMLVYKALHRFVSGGTDNQPMVFEHAFHIYDKKSEIFPKLPTEYAKIFESCIAVSFGALRGATKITCKGIWVWHNPDYKKMAELGNITTDTWYIMTAMFKLPAFTRNMIQDESGKTLFDSGWINSQPYNRPFTGNEFKMLLSVESVNECSKRSIHDVKNISFYTDADKPKQRRSDITKEKTILKWEPKISLEQGLKETIKYFENLMK